MATADPQLVRVVAQLTLNVTRNATGTLADGATSMVARIDGVERVESVDVTGLTPRLNDLQVTATVTCAMQSVDPDAEALVAERLVGGFGVTNAEDVCIDSPATTDGAVLEYG